MDLKSSLNIPYVKLVLNLVIIGIVVGNIAFGYQNWLVVSSQELKASELSLLIDDNRSTVERTDYFNSNLYKEKVFKEEGFYKKGELVYNTNLKENYLDKGQVAYIPSNSIDRSSNPEKWWQCIIGGLTFGNTNSKDIKKVNCKPL